MLYLSKRSLVLATLRTVGPQVAVAFFVVAQWLVSLAGAEP